MRPFRWCRSFHRGDQIFQTLAPMGPSLTKARGIVEPFSLSGDITRAKLLPDRACCKCQKKGREGQSALIMRPWETLVGIPV